jgi:AcrR family transcriptional regulator
MPVKKGEPLDPEATRIKIMRTAAGLFLKRGTHPVGVNEIADAAGVSKLTLYRHFESKEGLIRAFLEAGSDISIGRLERAVEQPGLSPDERILAVFDEQGRVFRERDYWGCPMLNTAIEWRGSRSVAGEIGRRHLDRVRALFERLCEDAGLADPAAAADQLVVLLEGAIMVRAVARRGDTDRDAREAARALLAGARRRRRRSRTAA